MKKIIFVLVMAVLAGCGGGSDSGSTAPTVTSISTSYIGSYKLTSTTMDMTNTSTSVRQVVTATPLSTPPYTGMLNIGGISWNKVLNTGVASAGTVTTVGTYRFTPTTNPSYGTFLIENVAGTAGKVGIYTVTSPYEITMDYEPENVSSGGVVYRVISSEKWLKFSDTP